MKRSDIEATYTVLRGMLCSPGKFEAEPIYAPYFYHLGLEVGSSDHSIMGEENGESKLDGDVFNVTPEERTEFPELEDAVQVILWYYGNGFVMTETRKAGDEYGKRLGEEV